VAAVVYLLCTLTSLACALMLLRAYARDNKVGLLLWSAACFFGLAANNALILSDVFHPADLVLWRKLPALAGVLLLVHGLIAHSR
jgi:hypothetical protein